MARDASSLCVHPPLLISRAVLCALRPSRGPLDTIATSSHYAVPQASTFLAGARDGPGNLASPLAPQCTSRPSRRTSLPLRVFLTSLAGDAQRGAHHMGPLDLPVIPVAPTCEERVFIIAHSAAGWISRIYLSEAR